MLTNCWYNFHHSRSEKNIQNYICMNLCMKRGARFIEESKCKRNEKVFLMWIPTPTKITRVDYTPISSYTSMCIKKWSVARGLVKWLISSAKKRVVFHEQIKISYPPIWLVFFLIKALASLVKLFQKHVEARAFEIPTECEQGWFNGVLLSEFLSSLL